MVRKQYVEVPLPMLSGAGLKLFYRLKGVILTPIFILVAKQKNAPGIHFRLKIIAQFLRVIFKKDVSLKSLFGYVFSTMDSTRYFEFNEVWNSIRSHAFIEYLDISSPRLLPIMVVLERKEVRGHFINPDISDLNETKIISRAFGIGERCSFYNIILEKSDFPNASFDLITCISVLEHLPQDRNALEIIWSLLRPGGKLLLTLPCLSESLDQYISHNMYGVLQPGEDGYTFWQHYYDQERLESCIYSVTGQPARVVLYGEVMKGSFYRNQTMKRLLGEIYPFWAEPYMMATEYKYYSSLYDLPGEGVVLLEFNK